MERFEILVNRINKFTEDRDWKKIHSPSNVAKSISIEASELLECFQWDDTNYNLEETKQELADVTTYCIQMAEALGIDLIDIVNDKLDITEKKYPIEKSKGISTKYNKL